MQYNAPFGSADPTAGFVNGNPSAGIAGSIPPAAAIEYTQREIVNTIVAAGLTPNNLDLTQLMQAVRGGALSYFADSGTQNLLIVNPNPAYITYFVGMTMTVKPAYGNTGPATINVNGISPVPIVKKGGTALSGGEWQSGDVIELKHNGTAFQMVGGGAGAGGSNLQLRLFNTPGSFNYVTQAGVAAILVMLWGGGASGGGVSSTSASGGGGGGGGWTMALLQVVAGQSFPGVIGAGAPRTSPGANNGTSGGTSSFGTSLMSATGGAYGLGASSGFAAGGAGGVGAGGTVNIAGGKGRSGFAINSTYYGGDGGSAVWSGEIPFTQGGYHDAEMFGQGGAGASSLSGSVGGSAGGNGACIVQAVG